MKGHVLRQNAGRSRHEVVNEENNGTENDDLKKSNGENECGGEGEEELEEGSDIRMEGKNGLRSPW